MLRYTIGDIFESRAQALVNPVNCVGVMGAGLAFEFKKRFPDNYYSYEGVCRAGHLLPGNILTYDNRQHADPDIPESKSAQRYILNAATKDHFGEKSELDNIDKCLYNIRDIIVGRNIESVAIPALGCGLGGLKWTDVRPLYESALRNMRAAVLVFEPK